MDRTNEGRSSQSPRGAGGDRYAPNGDVVESAAGAVSDVREAVASVAGQVTEQASSRLSEQIGMLSEQIDSLAEAAFSVSGQLRAQDRGDLAFVTDQAGERVRRLSGYLRGKGVDDLMEEVESFASTQPLLFAAGAFTLGVLAARFLKSSGRAARAERWRELETSERAYSRPYATGGSSGTAYGRPYSSTSAGTRPYDRSYEADVMRSGGGPIPEHLRAGPAAGPHSRTPYERTAYQGTSRYPSASDAPSTGGAQRPGFERTPGTAL